MKRAVISLITGAKISSSVLSEEESCEATVGKIAIYCVHSQ